jgi:hypothetical protein
MTIILPVLRTRGRAFSLMYAAFLVGIWHNCLVDRPAPTQDRMTQDGAARGVRECCTPAMVPSCSTSSPEERIRRVVNGAVIRGRRRKRVVVYASDGARRGTAGARTRNDEYLLTSRQSPLLSDPLGNERGVAPTPRTRGGIVREVRLWCRNAHPSGAGTARVVTVASLAARAGHERGQELGAAAGTTRNV